MSLKLIFKYRKTPVFAVSVFANPAYSSSIFFHPEIIQTSNPNVEVMFLPPNTTSLLQPMDQTVIATFKAYYSRRVVSNMLGNMLEAVNRSQDSLNPRAMMKFFWKNFTIADSLKYVQESLDEIKESTLNASWSLLLPEFVTSQNKSNELNLQEVLQDTANVEKNFEAEGFKDMHIYR